MTSTSRSLVLGVLTSLGSAAAEGFLLSLRASGFAGEAHLIVGRLEPREIDELRTMADGVHVVDDIFGAAPSVRPVLTWTRSHRGLRRAYPLLFAGVNAIWRRRRREVLEYHLEGLQALRYRLYSDFLADSGTNADFVMFSDVRDVWFQGDPFGDEPPTGLEVFLEDRSIRVGTEPFNRGWIRDLYGEDAVRRLGAHVVSCSGTVIGTRAEMVRYAGAMADALAGHRRPIGSHDQGAHNYLLRSGRLDPVRIVDNGAGRVFTMGIGLHPVVRGAVVETEDGHAPPVLHQYDRHAAVTEELAQQLRALREQYRR